MDWEKYNADGSIVLDIYKEILSSKDGVSYEVESHSFSEDDKIDVVDSETGIEINCNIPKQ